MAFCPATELKPGMVVAQPIKAVDGRVIIPPGTVLEAKHIHALRTWGIPGADVVPPAASATVPVTPSPALSTSPPVAQPTSSGTGTGTGTTSIPNLARQAEVQKLMVAGENVKKLFVVAGTGHPLLKDLARMALLRKAKLWNAPQHQSKPKAADG